MDEFENGVVEETTAEVAEPQAEPSTTEAEPDTEVDTEPEQQEAEHEAQPEPEKPEIPNEVWEKARKRAEREAEQRFMAERAAIDKNIAEAFAGQSNPYTGRPISSLDEFREYRRLHAEAQRKQQLDAAGIDPKLIESIVSEHPVVKQAAMAVQQMEQERAQIQVSEGIKEISSLDPDIKTADDIPVEIRPAFEQGVRSGLSYADAYKLAAWDKLTGKKVAAAKQAAINAAKGKEHQQATTGGSKNNAVHVPAEVMSEYKKFGYTEKEAAEHYAIMQKGK